MLGLSKKAVFKYAGIGTLIAVLGFFGWYFLSVLSERDDLLLDKQRLERSLDDCVEDQNKLISTLNEYEEEMEAIQRYSERLEQRAKELEQDREEAQRELDQKMEELDQIEIGEKCEDNMEFLREQAIERGED